MLVNKACSWENIHFYFWNRVNVCLCVWTISWRKWNPKGGSPSLEGKYTLKMRRQQQTGNKDVGITRIEKEGVRKTEGENYSNRTFSKGESKSEKWIGLVGFGRFWGKWDGRERGGEKTWWHRRAEWNAGESLSCGMHKIIIHKTFPLYSTLHLCVCICVCAYACPWVHVYMRIQIGLCVQEKACWSLFVHAAIFYFDSVFPSSVRCCWNFCPHYCWWGFVVLDGITLFMHSRNGRL